MTLEPATTIGCVECGGRCHLLSHAAPDEPFVPGDVVAYRCADCGDRFDVVIGEEAGPEDGREGAVR